METLHKSLSQLITTCNETDFDQTLNNNIENSLKLRGVDFETICKYELFDTIQFKTSPDSTLHWKYITVLSHNLLSLFHCMENETEYLLSINFQKCIRSSMEFLISIGLLPTLIPGVGIPLNKRTEFSKHFKSEDISPMMKYDRLKSICNLITKLCNNSKLKAIIFGYYFKDYLATLFQLGYAPIVRPGVSKLYDNTEFTMSEELWHQLQNEQKEFRVLLDSIISKSIQPMIIKDLLILQGENDPSPPNFMKKQLSKELSNILISKDGLLSTLRCFFNSPNIDIGREWKQIDVVKRLISAKHGSLTTDEYLFNICNQMRDIITLQDNTDFIIITAACIANLYEQYPSNKYVLEVIDHIINPFLFNNNEQFVNRPLIYSADEVNKLIQSLNLCFFLPKLSLPSKFLTPIIYHIFCIRSFCTLTPLQKELNNIILKHYTSKCINRDDWFNSLLFKKTHKDININNNIEFQNVTEGVQIKYKKNGANATIEGGVDCVLEIIEKNRESIDFARGFYVFCLSKLMNIGKENDLQSRDFLLTEDDTYDLLDKEREHMIIFIKALEKLISMQYIYNLIKTEPIPIMEFLITFLEKYADSLENFKVFRNEECVLICLSLLAIFITENIQDHFFQMTLNRLRAPLNIIRQKSTMDEIVFMGMEIENILHKHKEKLSKEKTEFDKAMDEVKDSMLPIRTHGIIHLTNLIKEKDLETISKRHCVQCVFEENLKSTDSYIYLSAINGLATLAKYSTEDVLEILTREYSVTKKGSGEQTGEEKNKQIETRMKIGEVLVKVTKNLGEMAYSHRSLLLNTFLNCCKDSDDLIRASSLSNLAEVCKELSYKLGPVLYEILNCIDSIILTDKSQECRRAAVLVISNLLKGLGKDTLYYLREALLPIYRTLKTLYNNESEDNTVRLHAQIGLEELDSVVKGIIFSPVKLEKKIFVIDQPN